MCCNRRGRAEVCGGGRVVLVNCTRLRVVVMVGEANILHDPVLRANMHVELRAGQLIDIHRDRGRTLVGHLRLCAIYKTKIFVDNVFIAV